MAHFYHVVESKSDLYQLENEVKKFLDQGWQLVGGVCVTIRQVNERGNFVDKGKNIPVYSQAMTRSE